MSLKGASRVYFTSSLWSGLVPWARVLTGVVLLLCQRVLRQLILGGGAEKTAESTELKASGAQRFVEERWVAKRLLLQIQ